MHRKNTVSVDGGPSGGSSMRRKAKKHLKTTRKVSIVIDIRKTDDQENETN